MTCEDELYKVAKDNRSGLFDDRAYDVANKVDELAQVIWDFEHHARASYPLNEIPEDVISDMQAARSMIESSQRILTKLYKTFCQLEEKGHR